MLRRAAPLLALVAALVLAPAGAAGAKVVLEAEAGFEGRAHLEAWAPVRARITADRLVRGTLRIGFDRTTVVLPVEVPGASVKEYRTVVGPLTHDTVVEVELLDGRGRRIAHTEASIDHTGDQELVGLLPAALGSRPLPGTAPLAVDAGTARFVRLDPALLPSSPTGLSSIGTIAAGSEDLAGLSGAQRAGLARWIAAGGRLLVDDPEAADGLPEAWQPGPDGRSHAGRGEVVAAGGAIAAGRWAGLVEPTGRSSPRGIENRRGMSMLERSLAARSGLRAPDLDPLFVALVVYALVAGPVTFLTLRGRRREYLAWIVIPVLALGFTAVSYTVAFARRGASRTTHATILDTSPAGTTAHTAVGLGSRGGGRLTVRFPRTWTSAWTGDGSSTGAPVASVVTASADGPEIAIPLDPGQFGSARSSGPAEAGGGLQVTAATQDGRIAGSVRNATPFALDDVAVLVGKNVASVGALPAGGEAEFSVGGSPDTAHFRLPSNDLFGFGDRRFFGSADLRYQLWQEAVTLGDDLIASGHAVAVGWTEGFRPHVLVNGSRGTVRGTTLILGRAPVEHGGGPVPSLAVSRVRVRGPADGSEPGADDPSVGTPLVLCYTVPGDVGSPVVLALPTGATAELYRDGAWQRVAGPDTTQVPQEIPKLRVVPRGFDGPIAIPEPPGFFPGRDGPEQQMDEVELVPPGSTFFVRIQPSAHTSWAYTVRGKT